MLILVLLVVSNAHQVSCVNELLLLLLVLRLLQLVQLERGDRRGHQVDLRSHWAANQIYVFVFTLLLVVFFVLDGLKVPIVLIHLESLLFPAFLVQFLLQGTH